LARTSSEDNHYKQLAMNSVKLLNQQRVSTWEIPYELEYLRWTTLGKCGQCWGL